MLIEYKCGYEKKEDLGILIIGFMKMVEFGLKRRAANKNGWSK